MLWWLILGLSTAAVADSYNFSLTNWQGYFDASSGVLRSLNPAVETSYDFSPSDYFDLRNGPGNYHTGDLTMRWRLSGQSAWQEVDSAAQRNTAPQSSDSSGSLLHSTFDNVFPDAAQYLDISRDWLSQDGDLVLMFNVSNKNASSVEIGAFGLPIEFNNIFTNRTSAQTTAVGNLADPYIGLDAGYVQITRLTGTGPNMVITPYTADSKFEAWRFLYEDTSQPTYYQSETFEGLYAWQTLSKAYAENEWNATEPWNPPTSIVLAPGKSVSFALRFGVAPNVYDIESAVGSKGIPVAVGLPGYVLPADMIGKLFLQYPETVSSISVDPSGALSITPSTSNPASWAAYDVAVGSGAFGRARATITYADGKMQTVHYFLTDTGPNTAANFGDFLFTKQWYTDSSDVFHRAPSVITYDYQAGAQVLQEQRAWIAGISDEAGAGSFEAAAMKSSIYPDQAQITQLEQMVNITVWGWLQDTNNNSPNYLYGVKRSLFFYEPDAVPGFTYDPTINWGGTWNKNDSYSVWRAYDYVHVSALYWSLYRAERASPGVLTMQNSTWYLLQAYNTALESQAVVNGVAVTAYAGAGLMCETHWVDILKDLKAENLTSEATALENSMKSREQAWSTQDEPFGSEQAWDSTGEEGVYAWAKYFGNAALSNKALNFIRGYMPTVPHWGWNGCARRYWDFTTGGKISRIERMIHHYGSGLNALPMLNSFEYNTNASSLSAMYDLRIGYGGIMGALTNINADGFGSQAFHSYPDTMAWEAYSGDYGPNFLGHILGSTTYLVEHPDFGWISMGGNLKALGSSLQVQPVDTVRRRIYVAPLGLVVQIDAGVISSFTFDSSANTLSISLEKASGQNASVATMVYEDTLSTGVQLTTTGLQPRLDGLAVPLPGTLNFSK